MNDDSSDDSDLTDRDLDEIAAGLEAAQQVWEQVAFLATEKIPCPECGGMGSVYGGSLGDTCPGCFGRRVVDHPGAEAIALPPFAQWRGRLHAQAVHLRTGLGSPVPRALLPSPAQLTELLEEGRTKAQQYRERAPVALPTPAQDEQKLLGSLGGQGPSDDVLDELEDDAEEDPS
jgi:hypothetical protein